MNDLNEVFYSACGLLGVSGYFVEAKWKDYAGLKARIEAREGRIKASVSRGFETASREVLLGLALYLVSSAFKKKIGDNEFIREYKEFTSRQSTSKLSSLLKKNHGRELSGTAKGIFYDLSVLKDKVRFEYQDVLGDLDVAAIEWSKEKSVRRLGFHEEANDRVVITKAFDSPRVPEFLVKYVIYHELLHKKHGVLFQRGKSLRRTVHPARFKEDEKKFVQFKEAEQWISSHSMRSLS